MHRWSKHTNYMDEVKFEVLGTMLCLLSEFLAAIVLYSFRITVLFFWYYHQS